MLNILMITSKRENFMKKVLQLLQIQAYGIELVIFGNFGKYMHLEFVC